MNLVNYNDSLNVIEISNLAYTINSNPNFKQAIDVCKLYSDAKIPFCKNGGYCVSIIFGKGIEDIFK